MTFFDEISKKISDVAESAVDKAMDLAETTKLNAALFSEEKQINQYYLAIGKVMYEQEKDDPNSPVAELIKKVLTSQQTIAEIRGKLAEIKEDKDEQPTSDLSQTAENSVNAHNTCSNCQTDNPENSKFCHNCGVPLPGKG